MGKKVKVVRIVDVEELGRAGGKARAEALGPEALSKAGRAAVNARWEKYYRDHPEKLIARQEREARKGTRPRGRPPKKRAKRAR
jgi:hypothetical protein